jgi:hypothetical protein
MTSRSYVVCICSRQELSRGSLCRGKTAGIVEDRFPGMAKDCQPRVSATPGEKEGISKFNEIVQEHILNEHESDKRVSAISHNLYYLHYTVEFVGEKFDCIFTPIIFMRIKKPDPLESTFHSF